MPTTDAQQTRDRRRLWAALSLAGVCLAAGCSAQAPAREAASSSPPTSTTRSSSPESSTPSATAAPSTTLPPVPPGAPADFGTGVSAQITAVRSITAVATAPGDIAGPALAISLRLTNGGAEAVEVDDVTVTATDGTGAAASPVTGDQAHPFSGRLRPGATQHATYPFRIPADAATGALIVISYRAGVPVATLTL